MNYEKYKLVNDVIDGMIYVEDIDDDRDWETSVIEPV